MRFFIIGFLLALASCGHESTSSTKVRGGDHLENHRFPAIGKLVNENSKVCTATAVDPWHIVTSATCLRGDPSAFTFIAQGVNYAVASIKYHPGYDERDPERSVNMASAKLGKALVVRWYPSPATESPNRCTEGLAVGFGEELNEQDGHNTGRLRLKSLYAIKNGDGWDLGGLLFGIGPKGQMTCDADEGGPVFDPDGKLAGVLSHYIYSPLPVPMPPPRSCEHINGAAYVAGGYYGDWAK